MKANIKQITDFLKYKKLGFVGGSRNPKKFGNEVIKHLLQLDYEILPVHKEVEEIQGLKCVKSIADLPTEIEAVCLVVPKNQTDTLLKQALEHGIKHIWIQQFSDGPETQSIIEASEANIVTGRCLFMYTDSTGVHRFHKKINKLFGTYAN